MKSSSPLFLHSKKRTTDVVNLLRKAMRDIEKEIHEHNGIYPFNGGRLSIAEVCRRAGVHKITLHGKTHRSSTKPEIIKWLQEIQTFQVSGKQNIKKSITSATNEWKDKYHSLVQKYNEMFAIHIISKQRELNQALAKIEELERLLKELKSKSSNGTITPIRPRKS